MRSSGARRLSAFLAALVMLLAGCYTLRPVGGTTPEEGRKFAFDVNDVGRVALGGSMGPEIAQIEGRLLRQEPGEFVVAVSTVRMLRGGEQVWSGEQVTLPAHYVSRVYERRFSGTRTAVFTTALIGSVVVFVITRDLIGFGEKDREPIDTNVVDIRIPIRPPLVPR